jgi:hydroxymethylpyrimidine pyrophosphatase-like HAD family hydrolase
VGTRQIDLVVTDLDGTLWDNLGHIHPATAAALTRLADHDIPVLAATARRRASALTAMNDVGITLPAVLCDGALGVDFTTDETLCRQVFDAESARTVLDAFSTLRLEPVLGIDHPSHDFVIGDRPSTHPAHLERNANRTRRVNLKEAVDTLPILSFTIGGAALSCLLPVLELTGATSDGSVTPDLVFGDYVVNIRPTGVSKWTGTLAFCRYKALDATRILAVGDADNDVEMLTAATIACVPEDGTEAALALATHRIAPAHEGGWAGILNLVL